jgi:hypothetical protein
VFVRAGHFPRAPRAVPTRLFTAELRSRLGRDLLLLTILRVPINRLVSKPKYDLHHHVSRDALCWQRIVYALNQLSARKPE